MLKQELQSQVAALTAPAAFGRLCVETVNNFDEYLCVAGQPPSGGCVLKPPLGSGEL